MKKALVVVALLLPGVAMATGFAKQSLFLSKSSVTEGDTVLIHAVVSNDSKTSFVGTLALSEGRDAIGTVPVSLAAGEADTVSLSWKPTAGSHSVTAQLVDASKTVVEEESATFTINAKPQPAQQAAVASAADTTTVVPSTDIQQSIKQFSPLAADTSKPVFTTLDTARVSTAHALDSGVAWSKQQIAAAKKTGNVLGAQITATTPSKSAGDTVFTTLWLVLSTALLYTFSVLRYVVANPGIFYPVFVILFIYVLWKLYRRFRRPRYSY